MRNLSLTRHYAPFVCRSLSSFELHKQIAIPGLSSTRGLHVEYPACLGGRGSSDESARAGRRLTLIREYGSPNELTLRGVFEHPSPPLDTPLVFVPRPVHVI